MSDINLEEYGLIRLIRESDREAFSALFKKYYAPLCSYALALLKFAGPAEDVVQETFIRLWENRLQLTIDVSLRAYLYRSVHNNCLTYIRSLAVSEKHNKAFASEIACHARLITDDLGGESLDILISGELEAYLDQVINSLPEQCKTIFCLSRYEQLSYQEIAGRLGISPNTVKTQMQRAFTKLRNARRNFEKN